MSADAQGTSTARLPQLLFGQLIPQLKQISDAHTKVSTQGLDRFEINPGRSFLVKQGDRVPMQSRVACHIADFELSLSHQFGQVALNHDMLRKNI
jgi:hypothetical protein